MSPKSSPSGTDGRYRMSFLLNGANQWSWNAVKRIEQHQKVPDRQADFDKRAKHVDEAECGRAYKATEDTTEKQPHATSVLAGEKPWSWAAVEVTTERQKAFDRQIEAKRIAEAERFHAYCRRIAAAEAGEEPWFWDDFDESNQQQKPADGPNKRKHQKINTATKANPEVIDSTLSRPGKAARLLPNTLYRRRTRTAGAISPSQNGGHRGHGSLTRVQRRLATPSTRCIQRSRANAPTQSSGLGRHGASTALKPPTDIIDLTADDDDSDRPVDEPAKNKEKMWLPENVRIVKVDGDGDVPSDAISYWWAETMKSFDLLNGTGAFVRNHPDCRYFVNPDVASRGNWGWPPRGRPTGSGGHHCLGVSLNSENPSDSNAPTIGSQVTFSPSGENSWSWDDVEEGNERQKELDRKAQRAERAKKIAEAEYYRAYKPTEAAGKKRSHTTFSLDERHRSQYKKSKVIEITKSLPRKAAKLPPGASSSHQSKPTSDCTPSQNSGRRSTPSIIDLATGDDTESGLGIKSQKKPEVNATPKVELFDESQGIHSFASVFPKVRIVSV
ncbi:hypothetical protein F4780DRAFT_792219 [Xylariomycetidae sp. FL0641]|nr:hypothetical protein F4780DRAFT_792219 [Xylariomycetidae sp. FL0641]